MNGIIKFIQKNSWILAISFWLLGVVYAGYNIYLTNQLLPLSHRIDTAVNRIEANEKKDDSEHPLFATEKEISDMKDDIKAIREDTRDIKNYLLNK